MKLLILLIVNTPYRLPKLPSAPKRAVLCGANVATQKIVIVEYNAFHRHNSGYVATAKNEKRNTKKMLSNEI